MGSISNNNNNDVGQMEPYWNLGEKEEEEASSFAFALTTDFLKYEVLKTVQDLGVLEVIKKSGPLAHLSAAEIVAKLPSDNAEVATAMLGRLLNFLVSNSVLTVSPITLLDGRVERRYGLAPVCKFYTSDEDGVSLASFLNTTMHKTMKDCCLCLKEAVLKGKEPFTTAYGLHVYDYAEKHPEYRKSFQKAMSDHSTLIMRKLLSTYKGFEGISLLVDVGGGNGATLNMILTQYPTIKGINFDQPNVIGDAPNYPGVEHVGGNFFAEVPKGDAIFLKWILHAFDDDASTKILKNCYDALPEKEGKVIICEYILPDALETSNNIADTSVVQFDVAVMMSGGKERTEKEFTKLALAAGFQRLQVACSAFNVKVIELFKLY